MFEHMMDPVVLGVALAVCLAVLLLAEALRLLWQRRFGSAARRLQRRLRRLSEQRELVHTEVLRQRDDSHSLLDRLSRRVGAHERLRLFLQQANLAWGPGRLLGATLVAGLLGYGLVGLVQPQAGLQALAGALCLAALPWAWVLRRRQRRLARLQAQLPDALDLMARALQAGHAFGSTLQMVAEEMDEPMASEFRTVHDEVNFGMGLGQAFAGLTARVPLSDLRYFAVAVLIQRESGGDLAQLLSGLARLIRNRLKLLARVRVLSSEGRLSAWILVVLPFALGGLLAWLNPEFMSPLWTDPWGITLVNWMLGLMAVGLLLIQKIVRLRV